jgi:membrane-associated protein
VHSLILAAGGLLSPEKLIDKGGLALVTAIIFAETGLLIGFFLPGDSLLFIAGFFASKPKGLPHLPVLPIVLVCLIVAAIIGNQVGFLIGKRVGPALFTRADSRFFKQANVNKAQAFFERNGDRTLILARFVPIVRTFVPVLAGVGAMEPKRFARFNIIGAVLWAGGVTTLGYFLGQIDAIRNHVEITLLALVAVSLVPVAIELVRHRRQSRAGAH